MSVVLSEANYSKSTVVRRRGTVCQRRLAPPATRLPPRQLRDVIVTSSLTAVDVNRIQLSWVELDATVATSNEVECRRSGRLLLLAVTGVVRT